MVYSSFGQIIERASSKAEKSRLAVVAAEDGNTLEAVTLAWQRGTVEPVLIGDETIITAWLKENCAGWEGLEIVHEPEHEAAAQRAIDMVINGRADSIMKGLIHTSDFMRAILKKESGLRTGKTACMLAFREMPGYHKLLAFADCGICIAPTLEQKREIIESCVETMLALGFDTPKVACLGAVEEVNPKMPDTLDSAQLKQLNQQGTIKNCIVEGPISYDLAVSKRAAEIKGYESPCAGDCDLVLFPDLVSANLTTKAISQATGLPAAILILGTRVPVIACSRASSAETKFLCIAFAAAKN